MTWRDSRTHALCFVSLQKQIQCDAMMTTMTLPCLALWWPLLNVIWPSSTTFASLALSFFSIVYFSFFGLENIHLCILNVYMSISVFVYVYKSLVLDFLNTWACDCLAAPYENSRSHSLAHIIHKTQFESQPIYIHPMRWAEQRSGHEVVWTKAFHFIYKPNRDILVGGLLCGIFYGSWHDTHHTHTRITMTVKSKSFGSVDLLIDVVFVIYLFWGFLCVCF